MSIAQYAAYSQSEQSEQSALIKRYGPLVRRIANQMAMKLPSSVDVDDLVQAGMIGLLDALSRFEQGHGAQFETFATQRIRGAMLDELRASDWVPRSTRKAQRNIEVAIQKLEQQLGRAPAESEVAAFLKLPIEQYHQLLSDARGAQLVYLDEFKGDDGAANVLENHRSPAGEDPLEKLRDANFKKAIVQQIDKLPERERLVMGLYYEKELSLKEIGAVLDVTESRVCQLHSQAIARLRSQLQGWIKGKG